MKRRWLAVAGLAVMCCSIASCQLMTSMGITPKSAIPSVFDRQTLVQGVREVFEPISAMLETETGDTLDFDRLRFFSATDLNGADETVVIVPLTQDSPSYILALQSEEEAPVASITPLPIGGFLSLDPSNCFHTLENGVPYLMRLQGYSSADVVDSDGAWVRNATDVVWNRGAGEPEWYKYLGNTTFHFPTCAVITMNQGK